MLSYFATLGAVLQLKIKIFLLAAKAAEDAYIHTYMYVNVYVKLRA